MKIEDRLYDFGDKTYQNRHILQDRKDDRKAYRSLVREEVPAANRMKTGMSVWDAYEKMANPVQRPTAASAEGTEQEKETETKSEIIVKPDGSKVLVMTMNIGGMHTQMSLEISKPTNMLDDHLKQENENDGMPDVQADMISDDASGIVTVQDV